MKINKTYKFRLYPNKEQEIMINKIIGCSIVVYNYYLDKNIKRAKSKKILLRAIDCIKDIPNLEIEYPFIKEIDKSPLRCALFNLEDNIKKIKKDNKFPKFRSKYKKSSFQINMFAYTKYGKNYQNITLDLDNHTITIPNIENIKMNGYKDLKHINGNILKVIISRDIDRKYYVCVATEEEINTNQDIDIDITKAIGIDLGIKDLIITSNGKKYTNLKFLKNYEKKIAKLQKRLSKKQEKSKNYYKLITKISKEYKKLRNARKYTIHQITKEITDEFDIIITENLKIKSMIANGDLAKQLNDASLYEIIRQLEYKCKWKNKKFIKINSYYPSSQICHNCGYKNSTLKDLNIRNYTCPNCGTVLDRDINAAINIKNEGLKMYTKLNK